MCRGTHRTPLKKAIPHPSCAKKSDELPNLGWEESGRVRALVDLEARLPNTPISAAKKTSLFGVMLPIYRNFFCTRNFWRDAELLRNFYLQSYSQGLSLIAHACWPEFQTAEPRGCYDGTKTSLLHGNTSCVVHEAVHFE